MRLGNRTPSCRNSILFLPCPVLRWSDVQNVVEVWPPVPPAGLALSAGACIWLRGHSAAWLQAPVPPFPSTPRDGARRSGLSSSPQGSGLSGANCGQVQTSDFSSESPRVSCALARGSASGTLIQRYWLIGQSATGQREQILYAEPKKRCRLVADSALSQR